MIPRVVKFSFFFFFCFFLTAGSNSNGSATGSARASPLGEHLIMKQEHTTTVSRSKSYPLKGAANVECSQTLSLNEKQEEKLASIEVISDGLLQKFEVLFMFF